MSLYCSVVIPDCHFAFSNYVYAIPIRKHFCPFSPSCSFLRYSYVHSLSMVAHKFKARVTYSNTIKLQVSYKCYIYLGVQKSKNYSILLLLKKSIISWSIGTFLDFFFYKKVVLTITNLLVFKIYDEKIKVKEVSLV